MVRPPHAHARIVSIDIGPAKRMPAVIAVLIVECRADSTDRHNTIFVGLSGDTGDRPRVASL